MRRTWRIGKAKHLTTAFSGEGTRLHGGRWTRKGRRAVYTSESVSLAALEILVHFEHPAALAAYLLIPVDIPGDQIETLNDTTLPPDWQLYPAPSALQQLGDAWLDAGKRAVLAVPSVIVASELNCIINPEHAGFASLVIGEPQRFEFDSRLNVP